MRISEAAKATGLSVSNIRFYEKKGLLAPARREESKYRDYSDQDVERLKRIILYRKMDMSLETIFLLMNGEVSLDGVLERQEEELIARREQLEGSIELCRRMRREQDPMEIDVDDYLNYVYTREQEGSGFAEVEELLEDWENFLQIPGLYYPLMGSPRWGRLVQNVWVRRGISAALLLLCFGWPVTIICGQIRQGSLYPPSVSVIFWAVWMGCLMWAFFRFRKITRKKPEEGGEER